MIATKFVQIFKSKTMKRLVLMVFLCGVINLSEVSNENNNNFIELVVLLLPYGP